MAELTPMMKQYMETKSQYQDCILFYRLGDFYEMFFDDALTASRELEITLTGKNCGQEERAPMCGVPYHAVDSYLNKLVSKGYKVAICEQMEDPKLAKGLVVLVICTLLSDFLKLYTLHWLLSGVVSVGLIAIVVIFQPELRRALEHLGRSRFANIMSDIDKEEAKRMVTEIVRAVESMSASRTGALMVIEKEITLNDIVETGTVIDAYISAEMIGKMCMTFLSLNMRTQSISISTGSQAGNL